MANVLAKVRGAIVRLTAMTNGQVLVGQTDAVPVPKTVSGDATLSAAGALTLAAGALAASVAGRAKMADAFFNAATVDSKFATDSIGEDRLAPNELNGRVAANVAEGNVIGGLPVVHVIDVPDGATGDVDTVLTHKTRVLDVTVVKTGGAGGAADTVQVKNGATAITDAMDINKADKSVVRAGTIDDAQWEVAAAGTLRVTRTNGAAGGNNTACKVIVTGVRVA
jgi:hypothetical protein